MMIQPKMTRVIVVPRVLSFHGYEALVPLLKKHFSGDWGKIGSYEKTHLTPVEVINRFPTRSDEDHDAKMNKLVCDGICQGRVMSSHVIKNERVWILTDEWGSEYETTCVMNPEDY